MAKTKCEVMYEKINYAVENQYKFRNDKNLFKYWKNVETTLRNRLYKLKVSEASEIVE